ncbi:hypothetical protein EDB89DRAFT_2188499 [Lactarius sanguifluus]|nr:hypothetical protein EDB89DRAFT_2188499 [Lactarius sanguifluus]
MLDAGNDETHITPIHSSLTISHRARRTDIARQNDSQRDDDIDRLDQSQRQKVQTSRKHILENTVKMSKPYRWTSPIREEGYLEEVGTDLDLAPEFNMLPAKSYEEEVRYDGNPLCINTVYLSHLREGFTVLIDTGHDTNEGNATSIGHARSNYAQAWHRSTKEYELLDHTLTLADPMHILKTCSVTPPNTTANDEKDDRPEQTLEDEAGIEAGATTRDQLPKLDSAASVAPQLTDQPDNDHWYVFPRNALEQPRSPDELATRPPILDRRNPSTRSIDRGDVQQPQHTNSTQTNHPQGSQRYRPYDLAAVRASTRTSRAGEQLCGCNNPAHEKQHCHRNKQSALCSSPGHAPFECLFPHSSYRPTRPCPVGAKHTHTNDNGECPWPDSVSKTPQIQLTEVNIAPSMLAVSPQSAAHGKTCSVRHGIILSDNLVNDNDTSSVAQWPATAPSPRSPPPTTGGRLEHGPRHATAIALILAPSTSSPTTTNASAGTSKPDIAHATPPSTMHPTSLHNRIAGCSHTHEDDDKDSPGPPYSGRVVCQHHPLPQSDLTARPRILRARVNNKPSTLPTIPRAIHDPTHDASSPQMRDDRRFCPYPLLSTPTSHEPDIDYSVIRDPTTVDPRTTTALGLMTTTAQQPRATAVLTTDAGTTPSDNTQRLTIPYLDIPLHVSTTNPVDHNTHCPSDPHTPCPDTRHQYAETHSRDTRQRSRPQERGPTIASSSSKYHDLIDYHHVTNEQAFGTNEPRRGRMSRSRDMTRVDFRFGLLTR